MEFLSHLPSTSPSANPLRPTVFEFIAQDQLRDLIQPALRYIVAVPLISRTAEADFKFYAQRHPRYLLRFATWYDEFYAGLMLLIDRHFLLTTGKPCCKARIDKQGGSFTENFYGLKRERTLSSTPLNRTTARVPHQVSERTKLRPFDIYKSLFMLVSRPPLPTHIDDEGWRAVSQSQVGRLLRNPFRWGDSILFNECVAYAASRRGNSSTEIHILFETIFPDGVSLCERRLVPRDPGMASSISLRKDRLSQSVVRNHGPAIKTIRSS
jgi:Pex2 / Pex12 amino terminal region